MARMTSRTASVATTRTMPSRAASWVAMVDLPTPVAPPIRITSGTSSCTMSFHRRKFVAYRSPARLVRTSMVISSSSWRVTLRTRCSSRRSSTCSATRYARYGGSPVTISSEARSPFEYGRPGSRSEITMTFLSTTLRGALLRAPRRALRGQVEHLVDQLVHLSVPPGRDRAVVDEHDVRSPFERLPRRDVHRRCLQLRQEHVEPGSGRQVSLQRGPVRKMRGRAHHPAPRGSRDVHPQALCHGGLCCRSEEHILVPHVCQRHRVEFRDGGPYPPVQPAN